MGGSSVRKQRGSGSDGNSVDKDNSRRAAICRAILDLLLFYTTAFFVLLAIFSILGLIFLVPFFIDPAWETLRANFDDNGTTCTTVIGVYKEGRSKCEWSSCEEGCTKTVFTCWQIEVEYELPGVSVGDGMVTGPKSRGRLFPNVKGCGYPPRTVCSDFVSRYATNGTVFECFVSRTDPTLVVADLDLDQVRSELFYSLAIPLPCLFVSIVYIFFAYFYIYNDKPNPSYRPAALLSSAGAMAALIDVRTGPEDHEDKQRRLLLLQAQRAKLLAQQQQQHSKSTSFLIRSAVASATGSAVSLPTVSKDTSSKRKKSGDGDMISEKAQKYRREYGQEKYSVMQYYQYYGIL